jgi:hypothetical protein
MTSHDRHIAQQTADLETHHIEGYAYAAMALGKESYFDVPLISHVQDGLLWAGGVRDGVRLPDDFQYVISLYTVQRYDIGPRTIRREYLMYDADDIPTMTHRIADVVNDCLSKGVKTLVHCQAGLNRSALVVATAMIKRGWEPAVAVKYLRDARSPLVLCNPIFEEWILKGAPES